MAIDGSFDPRTCLLPSNQSLNGFAGKIFWECLDGKESVPTATKKRFYVPKGTPKKDWPARFDARYQLKAQTVFDLTLVSLPDEVTPERIAPVEQKYNAEHQQCFVPMPPYEKLTPHRYLEIKQDHLLRELGAHALPWPKVRDESTLSDFERRVLDWSPHIGLLEDHRVELKKTFEVSQVYYFHSPSFPELVLTLAPEINTGRPIFGFAVTFGFHWPFDFYYKDKTTRTDLEFFGSPSIDRIVASVNYVLENIEYAITNV